MGAVWLGRWWVGWLDGWVGEWAAGRVGGWLLRLHSPSGPYVATHVDLAICRSTVVQYQGTRDLQYSCTTS